ncbi:hypothetical protein BD560DRAFT_434160 [Blakeslea trispora]|nr:hypothetical protein BD560DRAFT_434160 [Blakeslea trispora]
MTTNLSGSQTLERQASDESFGERPSLSFLSSVTSPVRFSEPQNSLDTQINRMRRSITVSPHLFRKGKESHQFRTELFGNSNTRQQSTEISSNTENVVSLNDNAEEESTHLKINSQESVMPYSDGETKRTEEAESPQNINTTTTIEGDITNNCSTTKRKRGKTSRKATQSKKKPKQGSCGSMDQFVFRFYKN